MYNKRVLNKAIANLKDVFVKYFVPTDIILTKDHNTDYKSPTTILFCMEVLQMAGFTEMEAAKIYNGYPKEEMKADGEYPSYSGGWGNMYDSYALRYAVDAYIKRILKKDLRMEVGMKYPQFSFDRFVKKFGVVDYGIIPHRMNSDLFYECYIDKNGNMYSFQKGMAGKGGYAGASFKTKELAFEFTDWLLGYKSHYIKDLDLQENRLGGLRWEDYEANPIDKKEMVTL